MCNKKGDPSFVAGLLSGCFFEKRRKPLLYKWSDPVLGNTIQAFAARNVFFSTYWAKTSALLKSSRVVIIKNGRDCVPASSPLVDVISTMAKVTSLGLNLDESLQ